VSFSLSADPWAQVCVSWTGSCVIPDQNAIYAITVKVWNCETSQWEFNTTVQKNTNLPNSLCVDLTQFCTVDEEEPIYKIFVIVRKIRISDGAVICQGHAESDCMRCADIAGNTYNFGPITLI
jgi:hypothetical protein